MTGTSGRIATLAVTASFWAWSLLLSYPLMTLKVDLSESTIELASAANENGLIATCQIVGLALFTIVASTAYYSHVSLALNRLPYVTLAILAIFFLSLALQLHDEELRILLGIFYTCLLIAIAVLLSTLWTMPPDDLERCLTGASIILCSFGVSATAILGLPDGRSVGNIHPNGFSVPLLAAFIFSQFRAGWTGIVIRILCAAMIAMVSSRFALIGCIIALLAHELTFNPLSPRKIPVVILGLIGGSVFWPQIAGVLALGDPERDVSSGFSGRGDLWQQSLAVIADQPLGIGFKRVVLLALGGHNGYLKTLLEFGIAGGGLIIFFIACIIVSAGIDAVASHQRQSRPHRFACARFGGLLALLFGAFFQPQLFSLGDVFGISLLFLLFKPKTAPLPDRVDISRMISRRTISV